MTATISLSNVVETVTIRILLGLLRHDSPAVRRRPWNVAVALHRRHADVPGDVSISGPA
jgi:ABC-2 type transport system ATP-binding protein